MRVTGNSFLNAFKVLAKKPVVLLLLFPLHAIAPFLLLLLPLLEDVDGRDNTIGMIIMLALLCLVVLAYLYMIVRAVLLVSPAMELLRDGAAGQDTPKGWFLRGLKRHWWKRLVLGCAEQSVSTVMSTIVQVILPIPVLMMMPLLIDTETSGDGGAFVSVMIAFYVLSILVSVVMAAVMFLVESLSSFLLTAFADRGFGASFQAVFGKVGRRKFAKLLGGRFLIALVSLIVVATLACGGLIAGSILQTGFNMDQSYRSTYDIDINPFESIDSVMDILPFAVVLAVCMLAYGLLEIYRFSYEFCVFQEVKNEEPPRLGQNEPIPAPIVAEGSGSAEAQESDSSGENTVL